MIVITLVSWLLIGCLIVSSQSTDQDDNRWVWRSLRRPSTSLELPFNPFEPFPSSSEENSQPNSKDSSFQGVSLPRGNREAVISQRGNPEGALLSSFSPDKTTTPIPNVDLNLASLVGRSRSPSFVGDSRRAVQQNLGIAHFTIPRQLGRPVTITTPTSNHLHPEHEPLVSSYSSLDAEVTGLNELKKPKNRGRNLINPPVRKALGSIAIKPLPIDISKLPLESTERAEGIKKLWSSLTSRTEFAQIFEALAGRRRNSSSEHRENNPTTEAESSSILLDPHNSISESVIRVINPPQIQLQQQILKQQLRQQELQKRLQEQFEAEIQQVELKKQLELQNLIREREEERRIAVQQKAAQEQQLEREELLRRQQQQAQTEGDSKELTEDEHLSEELQDPEDILRRRHELLVERLRRGKESQSEQRRTREQIQERRRRLHELQQQQRLQQLRQRLVPDVISTTSSTVTVQPTSTEPSENDVSEEIPQRPSIVFPPPLPVPSRSLSPPIPDTRGITNQRATNTSSTIAESTPADAGTNTEGTKNDDVTSSGTRDTRTVSPGASGTDFSGTTTGSVPPGTNTDGTNTGVSNTSGTDSASNLLQTTVRFPQREGEFVVRKIRLPGNHIMNVVFVPDEKNFPGLTRPRPDISQSPSALRLFQSEDVQQSLLEVENQNTVLVVEELIREGKNLYLITTMEGDRVYPKEPNGAADKGDGNVWAAFVGVFSGQPAANSSSASSFSFRHDSPTTIGSSDDDDDESEVDSFAPVIRDPRTPLAKVRFSAGNVQGLRGRSELLGRSSENFQAPHAFVVKFSGRENRSPFAPVSKSEFLTRPSSLHQNKRLELPSSSVSTRFFNPFRTQAQQLVGRSLRVQASGGGGPPESDVPNEARGLQSSHSRWPWPHEVPANLDAFFPSGPGNFRTTRSLT